MDVRQSISQSVSYIHKMYAETITVQDAADSVYLSPSYFSFMFRTLTGYTVKNYLNRYRLYRAAHDLINSGKRIAEITYTHGFTSQQSFTRSFTNLYGVSPAQFRRQSPALNAFPPEDMLSDLWKEPSMESASYFENVKFIRKEAFYVVGLEADIHYNTSDGTSPIGTLWDRWKNEGILKTIPDNVLPAGACYGITNSEREDNTGKYMVCTEVSTLENLPQGLTARRFGACERAVFEITLETLWTGQFWKNFYTKWLPNSGYAMIDSQIKKEYPTFTTHPDIEYYPPGFEDEKSVMQVMAPVVKL